VLSVQTSPVWTQNDEAAHTPPEQRPEQHSPLAVQVLPSVLHVVLSGVHMPFAPQLPPQHCALVEHAAPSAVHVANSHTLFVHAPEQHSPAELHAEPTPEHIAVPAVTENPVPAVAVAVFIEAVDMLPVPVAIAPPEFVPVDAAPVPVLDVPFLSEQEAPTATRIPSSIKARAPCFSIMARPPCSSPSIRGASKTNRA
jgi:hypothetical protein